MRRGRSVSVVLVHLVFACTFAGVAHWDLITDNDIVPTLPNTVGPGNGTLDLLLLHDAQAGAGNADAKANFNADDACTDMPHGSGTGSDRASGSYVTSRGEIRAFYIFQFIDNEGGSTASEIALYLDMNQTTGKGLMLKDLTLLRDFAAFGDGGSVSSRPTHETDDRGRARPAGSGPVAIARKPLPRRPVIGASSTHGTTRPDSP